MKYPPLAVVKATGETVDVTGRVLQFKGKWYIQVWRPYPESLLPDKPSGNYEYRNLDYLELIENCTEKAPKIDSKEDCSHE